MGQGTRRTSHSAGTQSKGRSHRACTCSQSPWWGGSRSSSTVTTSIRRGAGSIPTSCPTTPRRPAAAADGGDTRFSSTTSRFAACASTASLRSSSVPRARRSRGGESGARSISLRRACSTPTTTGNRARWRRRGGPSWSPSPASGRATSRASASSSRPTSRRCRSPTTPSPRLLGAGLLVGALALLALPRRSWSRGCGGGVLLRRRSRRRNSCLRSSRRCGSSSGREPGGTAPSGVRPSRPPRGRARRRGAPSCGRRTHARVVTVHALARRRRSPRCGRLVTGVGSTLRASRSGGSRSTAHQRAQVALALAARTPVSVIGASTRTCARRRSFPPGRPAWSCSTCPRARARRLLPDDREARQRGRARRPGGVLRCRLAPSP